MDLKDALLEARVFLVDASGVLYTDEGLVSGAKDFFSWAASQKKHVLLCTNNTSQSPQEISARLKDQGVLIDPSFILSSGLGLSYDARAKKMVSEKRCFCYGYEGSRYYIEKAGGILVEEIKSAQVLCLMASLRDNNKSVFDLVYEGLMANKEIEIICANPDRYVYVNGLYPVIGYYADKLLQKSKRDCYWIGKPERNFSNVVARVLAEKLDVGCDQRVLFFDDNIDNILAMQEHLGISGVLVRKTGLAQVMDVDTICQQKKQSPVFSIDQLGLF